MKEFNVCYYDNDKIQILAAELVTCFSEFLEDKGIMFLNSDTDEYQLKNRNALYGEDVSVLLDMVQNVLDKKKKYL